MNSIKLLFLSVAIIVYCSATLTAQEIPGAFNYHSVTNGNSRTDGKPEISPLTPYSKSERLSALENQMMELKRNGITDENTILSLQKQIDAESGTSVTMPAAYYPGSVRLASGTEQNDAVGNSTILTKNNIKSIATVTEYTGATAGKIWVVTGFSGTGTSANPDSLRVYYSTDNGSSWYLFAYITLGNTDKLNTGDLDVELIEGGTNKFLHILYGLRASGGTGKWFAGGTSMQLTGSFNSTTWAFTWPGDDATKRYYCPRIVSDVTVWPTAPWAYIAVSFDSAGATGRVNTQKFAQLNSPNSYSPVFMYKTQKIFWYSETPVQENLYTDIAFFQRNFADSIIISYCGVPDSTKVFFSKMSASGGLVSPGNPGQYIGPIGGSEPNYMKYGGRLSSNGNSNGSVIFIFNQRSPAIDGVKYFRTTNFGDFNLMNQSVVWTGTLGVSNPDIAGVRNGASHRFAFFFRGAADSLKYVSLNSDGTFGTNSGRMNYMNSSAASFGPAAGMRFVSGDSCFAVFSGPGSSNVYSSQGCAGVITGVGVNETPAEFSLKQNYPNPFNPSTRISFAVPKNGFVSLKVYDLLGREVSTLVNESKSAGSYTVDFNATGVPSGVYFCRMESQGYTSVIRMLLMK